jgi:23S rRNA (uridine2552-2'-O)-methyltransferase
MGEAMSHKGQGKSGHGGKPGAARNASGSGRRGLKVRVETAKKRKLSSTLWLERQLNDPYVASAKREGYRSRAAYKLKEIDDKYRLLKPGQVIIDLGAAPGGWSQVAIERVRPGEGAGLVIGIDLTAVEPLAGLEAVRGDFLDEAMQTRLRELTGGRRADGVLSDMAAPATGHRQTDHLRIMGLCEEALSFAREVLAPGGFFLAKVLRGGTESAILNDLKRDFAIVRHVKPKASRADSAELYVLATGFRG